MVVQLNNNIMNFFTYLYYKYYRFQVRVGNGDIALFSSIIFMIVLALLYYGGVQLFLLLIFADNVWNTSEVMISGMVILCCALLLWYWFCVWRGKRYKKIIEYYEKISPKRSCGAILVALGSFLIYLIGGLLMLLRNNGII